MCGRYTATARIEDLVEQFEVDEVRTEELPPRYNVAPGQPILAIAARPGGDGSRRRAIGTFRWGLVPRWASDPSVGTRMINARAETVATKPAYRDALARRRCLIPADAFYEWRREGPGRKAGAAWAIRRRDGRTMALAGIWEVWRDADGVPLRTAAILTTAANAVVAPIHHRMPALLDDRWNEWLDPDVTDPARLVPLLVPAPEELLEAFRVSSAVNSVANDGPELLVPALEPAVHHEPLFGG